jgi:hypothetical protein
VPVPRGGSIGSATGLNSLSNSNTTNGTGGVPGSNAQDAASRGHSGKAMGAEHKHRDLGSRGDKKCGLSR